MIIIPPDKTQDNVTTTNSDDQELPHESQTLPGPPLAAPKRSNQRNRKRKIRIAACAIIVLSLVAVFHTLKYTDRVEKFRHKTRKLLHRLQRPPLNFYNLQTIERTFLAVPNNESAIATSQKYASIPHLAGSERDLETARMFLEHFQLELGIAKPEDEPLFDAGSRQSQRAIRGTTTVPRRITKPIAWIDTYYPVLNTGLERKVEILNDNGGVEWSADLEEDQDPADPDAARYHDAIPTWHGLSKDGDVTGPIVYAKYGRKSDFDSLQQAGVDFKGTIALVRYGGVFRGLKVKAAQEAGCVGILIYSDPHDDAAVTVENGFRSWPHGPARNPTSVQRGSVQFISSYPGDPTTPGYPSYKNATRVDATSIPSIPSLPISWNTAKRLLIEIKDGIRSKPRIRLLNKVDDKVTPIYNTMAIIPGMVSEQAVLVGNHRDAWVLGAADPTSGTVCMYELVRGLGALLRTGWTPFRTIILASWDAEEYGLVGSTEWGEDFEDWIQAHVVAYLNLDVSVSGSRYNLKGSPSLAHLVMNAAISVPHPYDSTKTLWDARLDHGPFTGPNTAADSGVSELVLERLAEERDVEEAEIPVRALGSGSDYTVMLQRLGIASTDMGFGSTLTDAVYHYHSIYDSQTFQETYADPGFHKHVAVAQHLGLMTLRISESVILPINTTHYSFELLKYLRGVENLASANSIDVDTSPLRSALRELLEASLRLDSVREKLLEQMERANGDHERFVDAMVHEIKTWVNHKLGYKPKRFPFMTTEGQERVFMEVEAFMLAPEHAPALELYEVPINLTDLKDLEPDLHSSAPISQVREISIRLSRFEQGFLSEAGIKDREWYRHLGVAPGKWLGYGATPFPALSEAITIEKNVTLAKLEVGRLVEVVETLISTLSPSTSLTS
ncbi:hypothetical protein FRC17_000444 [Serendipita sp. 399]|nr:hypothetical protein FRC17_000444 [Serendipita sp. 399]